jgi:hypothetical protein
VGVLASLEAACALGLLATAPNAPGAASFNSANNLAWNGQELVTGSVWGIQLIEDVPALPEH